MMLKAGSLLICKPSFIKDYFTNAVVLLVEYNAKGAIGFILNNPRPKKLEKVLKTSLKNSIPVFNGGPINKQTIHFVHRNNQLINGGSNIVNNLYWGGNLNETIGLIQQHNISQNDIKFFYGYCGWEKGQLENEIFENCWIVDQATEEIVFNDNPNNIWQKLIALP